MQRPFYKASVHRREPLPSDATSRLSTLRLSTSLSHVSSQCLARLSPYLSCASYQNTRITSTDALITYTTFVVSSGQNQLVDNRLEKSIQKHQLRYTFKQRKTMKESIKYSINISHMWD